MSLVKNNTPRPVVVRRVLGATALLVLVIILVAGLTPFNPIPPNEVRWIDNQNGLRFGDNAIVYSVVPLQRTDPSPSSSATLEFSAQFASDDDRNTFISFYTPMNPRQFRLEQYKNNVLIRRAVPSPKGTQQCREIELKDVIRRDSPILITVTTDSQKTSIYMNGRFQESSTEFALQPQDISGQIVLGTSPVQYATWAGDLRGLAIYPRELTATEVSEHFEMWTGKSPVEAFQKSDPVVLYFFQERAGDTVHNLGRRGPDLFIPKHFSVIHKVFLERPWNEFTPNMAYFSDFVLNVAGFIPFGFIICAYLKQFRLDHPGWSTILLGATTSIFIEIAQFFIPTRSSGITDILTNTLGTALGVLACHASRGILSRLLQENKSFQSETG